MVPPCVLACSVLERRVERSLNQRSVRETLLCNQGIKRLPRQIVISLRWCRVALICQETFQILEQPGVAGASMPIGAIEITMRSIQMDKLTS